MPVRSPLPILVATVSILCWLISLAQPAVDMGVVVVYGWQFLFYGWQGLVELNIGGLSWLTNPLLWGAWLSFFAFHRHRTLVMALSLGACVTALTSFLFNALGSDKGGVTIEDFALGFHLWLASAVLQAVAAIGAGVTGKDDSSLTLPRAAGEGREGTARD
jgi:hypothetical protein